MCYGRKYGPKGYGFGGGGAFLSTDGTVADEQKFQKASPVEPSPLSPPQPKPQENETAPKKKVVDGVCPTCDKTVYFAEQVVGPGNIKYHKACFKCCECRKTVETGNCSDKDTKIYCKTCYSKVYGPKGFGFGNTIAYTT